MTAPSGWTTANQNGTVTATIPTLAAGVSANFTLTVLTNNTPGVVNNNTVSIDPTTWDNNITNNSVQFTTTTDPPTMTSISAPTVTYGSNALVMVTVSSNGGTPTGNVTLTVDNGPPITQALVNGSGTFTLSGLAAGNHNLNASYAAQGAFETSSTTGTLSVIIQYTPAVSVADAGGTYNVSAFPARLSLIFNTEVLNAPDLQGGMML
jgi:hypothetical protein